MIIDVHTHTGGRKFKCSLDDIAMSMKNYGIDKSVVFPMKQPGTNAVVNESLKNVRSNNRRFIYFLRFSPQTLKLTRLKKISGRFSGFKLHPRIENFDPLNPKFKTTFQFLEKLGKPVIIHSRKENSPYSDPDRIIKIAKMYPNINFIFGHFANDSEEFFKRVLERENIFVETSMVSSPKIIEMRVKQIGADRIVFGSDFPYSDQEIELLKIKKAKIKNGDKEKILYKNILGLLESEELIL